MQQFARRQPGEGPGNQPDPDQPKLAEETVAQILDQVCEVKKHLAGLASELGLLKAENQRLRVQMTGMIASQEVGAEAPHQQDRSNAATEPTAAQPQAYVAELQQKESIDEELLVEWVRGSGLQETEDAPEATAPIVETPIEKDPVPVAATAPDQPMSDDEIQKLLAKAALDATDAAPKEQEAVAAEATQPAVQEPAAPAPSFLRVEEATPEPDWPFVPDFEASKEAIAKVPSHLAIGALAVPVRIEGGKIFCKAVVPFDRASLDMIADAAACEIVPEPAPIEQVVAALRTAYHDEQYESERAAAWQVAQRPKKRGALARLFRKAA